MTNKIVKFDHEMTDMVRKGVATLAKAVKSTMGPRGKTVLIERPNEHPIVTKDGVTVAKSINLKNKFENLGVQVVKEAASRSAEEAGDGTTTATVLTQAIYENGLRMISSGEDPVSLRKSIEHATEDVLNYLEKTSKKLKTKKELRQIALISCNGEEEIADLITQAIHKVKEDGSVIVEEAKGYKSELNIVEGFQIDRGYLSPYFITDQEKMHGMFEKPYVLVCNKKIDSIKDIMKPLEIALETGKPLLLVANDCENEALQGLVLNKMKGNLKICAIKSPGFGEARHDLLGDIASVTGCKVWSESEDMSNFTVEDFGICKKVIVKRSTTLFVGLKEFNDDVSERIKSIKYRLNTYDADQNEIEVLKYRLRQLSGGIAVLRVGAATEAEMIERRDRVDDALNATRAALREGIIPGGGVALIKASSMIQCPDNSMLPGYSVIARACQEPIRQIVLNTGKSPEIVIEKILLSDKYSFGYDARSEKYGDLYDLGVIDPVRVVRCALQNACSAATLLLTSDCAMVNDD